MPVPYDEIQEQIETIIEENLDKAIEDQAKIIVGKSETEWDDEDSSEVRAALIKQIKEKTGITEARTLRTRMKGIIPPMSPLGYVALEKIILAKYNQAKKIADEQREAINLKTPIKSPIIVASPSKDQNTEDLINEEEQSSETLITGLPITPKKSSLLEQESPRLLLPFDSPPPPQSPTAKSQSRFDLPKIPSTPPEILLPLPKTPIASPVCSQPETTAPVVLPSTPIVIAPLSPVLVHAPHASSGSPVLSTSLPQAPTDPTLPNEYKMLEAYIEKMEGFKNKNQLHSGSFYGKSNQVEKLKTATNAINMLKNAEMPLDEKQIALQRYLTENRKYTGIALFHKREGDLESIFVNINKKLISDLASTPYENNFADLKIYIKTAKEKQKENTLSAGLSIKSFMIKSNQVKKLELAEIILNQKQLLQANSPASLDELNISKQVLCDAIKENIKLTAGSNPFHSDGKLHNILEKLKNEIEAEITQRESAAKQAKIG